MSTEVNIAIVCITENGKNLALKIQTLIKDSHVVKKKVMKSQKSLQLENDTYTIKNDKLNLDNKIVKT